MIIDGGTIGRFAEFYRRRLLEDVMPFWEMRTKDEECGGYITCFDRFGNITGTDKYVWLQGRQLWTFSALFNSVEPRPEWIDLARHGRDFILKHTYAGDGRWNYQLDRWGNVKERTISIFTDLFVLEGLCEFAIATKSDADMALIRDTYDAMERNAYDPEFKDIFHGTWSPRYKKHSVYLIAVHVAGLAERVLGVERTRPLIDHCLEKILYFFAKDDLRAHFESVAPDGSLVDDPEGRLLNPGHTMESMWFCMEEGVKRGDRSVIDRAAEIAGWAWDYGWDKEYGGIFSYLDSSGSEPVQTDWHKDTGALWHDKIWWGATESLYALALSAIEMQSPESLRRFAEVHEWSQRNFYDTEFGEWYPELHRDGRPKKTYKGSMWKAAYHIPRSLMKVALLFGNYADK